MKLKRIINSIMAIAMSAIAMVGVPFVGHAATLTDLTNAQIATLQTTVGSAWSANDADNINFLWHQFCTYYTYDTADFTIFTSFVSTLRTISPSSKTPSTDCPTVYSAYIRAVYAEAADETNKVLDVDAIYDCMANRIQYLQNTAATAFAKLNELNPYMNGTNGNGNYYWLGDPMLDPLGDCIGNVAACQALIESYTRVRKFIDNNYSHVTSLPNNYYTFSKAVTSLKIGDFYFSTNS